jgi:hypothetical protein
MLLASCLAIPFSGCVFREHMTNVGVLLSASFLYLSRGEWLRLSSTARIGRARFYYAPSKLARNFFRDGG